VTSQPEARTPSVTETTVTYRVSLDELTRELRIRENPKAYRKFEIIGSELLITYRERVPGE
jgi:hypothetical protein